MQNSMVIIAMKTFIEIFTLLEFDELLIPSKIVTQKNLNHYVKFIQI